MAVSVPRNKIVIDEPARLGFIGNDAIEAAMIATQQSSAKSKRSASLAVVVTLTDLGLLSRVQDFLAQKDVVTLESPLFELTDSRAARRAAIADAIQKARADAEAYAASLGMRVTRITAIKDQNTEASPFGDYSELIDKFAQQKNVPKGKVETDVRVAVDFELSSQ